MIRINDVNKSIKGNIILKDITLELKKGQLILLRGHNGCGKTMLLRLIARFIKPTSGSVVLNDQYTLGVIIETPAFFLQESAYKNLKYLADINKIITKEEIFLYLKKFGLFDVKDNKVKTFSLGMKQRLALCQAFMENPDILLLDEPFNAIDDDNLKIVTKLIKESQQEGKLIVIASHGDVKNLDFDKVITMTNGVISSIE